MSRQKLRKILIVKDLLFIRHSQRWLFLAAIAHAAHSFYAVRRLAELAAKAGYMHVHSAFVPFELIAPYRGKQFFTGTDAACIEKEVFKDPIFERGEVQRFALNGNASALLIEAYAVPRDDALAVVNVLATQYGTDAKHEFAYIEGLHHIVVSPVFEADDAIHFFASGGEHEDGAGQAVAGALVQFAAHGKPVAAGKHKIEHDKIRLERFGKLQTFDAVGGLFYSVAFIFKRKGHEFANIVVVFDYKYDSLFGVHFSSLHMHPYAFYADSGFGCSISKYIILTIIDLTER